MASLPYKSYFLNNKNIRNIDQSYNDLSTSKFNHDVNILLQKRRKVLMNKKKIELQHLLQAQYYISTLRKTELVDKVLFLEFGKNSLKN